MGARGTLLNGVEWLLRIEIARQSIADMSSYKAQIKVCQYFAIPNFWKWNSPNLAGVILSRTAACLKIDSS